jgi:hypothetical protein
MLGLGGKPMNCIRQKRMWLAGASLLALVLGSGDANAVVFGDQGIFEHITPSTGWYGFTVAGAHGGDDDFADGGGAGAIVGGELFLAAGQTLDLIVGGGAPTLNLNGSGGGGGGGSFVDPGSLLFAAGGGGGAGFLHVSGGHPGVGSGGYPAGLANYGGAGGDGVPSGLYGTIGGLPATAGSGFNGGQGAQACFASGVCFPVAPDGGFEGGGGGGYQGGGGGGGASGGGAGDGGFSYVTRTARNAFGITGGNAGIDGYVSINFVAAPEPSTWALTLAGFAGVGWLAHWRRRKVTA